MNHLQIGWVKSDTKAIQSIHDSVITHNTRVQVSFYLNIFFAANQVLCLTQKYSSFAKVSPAQFLTDLFKPGGLNSRDQSRLILRPLDLSSSVFKTYQDLLNCLDTIYFCLGQDFKNQDFSIKILLRQVFYWDFRDCQDKSRFLIFVETFQDLPRYHLNIVKTFVGLQA